MIIKLRDMTDDQKQQMVETSAFQKEQIELSDIIWEDGLEIVKQKANELNKDGFEIDFEPENADLGFSSQGWYFSRYPGASYLSFTIDLPNDTFFTGEINSYWNGDLEDLGSYTWTNEEGEDVEAENEDEIKPYLDKVKSVYTAFINLIGENENGADYDNVIDYLIGRGASWDDEKEEFVWNNEE